MSIAIEIEIGSLLVDAELIDEARGLADALPFEAPFEERDGAFLVKAPVHVDIAHVPARPAMPGQIVYIPDTRMLALVLMPSPFLAQAIGKVKGSPDELSSQSGEILVRFQRA